MATFFLRSFGCRANQAEGEALAAELARRGLEPRRGAEGADWIVLNTCTVTAEADTEARRELRRLRRRHPGARIAVTGCYAERAPGEIAALDGVALVAGNRAKAGLAERIAEGQGARSEGLVPLRPMPGGSSAAAHARPVVKAQEGCDRRCSFCIVPLVRGAGRSRPLGEILAEIEAHARGGAAEVVLSGINLGQWGKDRSRELDLAALVRAILEKTRLRRLRLSSVEPADWTPELTSLFSTHAPRLARHVHLPLQSLSDGVLRRMRRRYRARAAAVWVCGIAAAAEGCAIGADVMAGFPGESEVEFEETRTRLAELPLAYLHVFPFSPRPGTEAAEKLASGEWRGVAEAEIARRAAALRQLDAGLRARFRRRQAGQTMEAVALHGSLALTDNYLEVKLAAPARPGEMIAVQVSEVAA